MKPYENHFINDVNNKNANIPRARCAAALLKINHPARARGRPRGLARCGASSTVPTNRAVPLSMGCSLLRAVALCLLAAEQPLALPLQSGPGPSARRLPVAVAHRGASGDAPENTMAAIRLADQLGAAGYETDLHLTRDGEIVLLHDSDIRRTTRGWPSDLPSYNINDLDWAFVSTLDAGSWFAPEFEGERVPLLREGLDFARATGGLAYLDVKSTATGPEGLAAISQILEEYEDISDRVLLGVWSEGALADANAVGLPQRSQLSFIASLPPAQASFERFIELNREQNFLLAAPRLFPSARPSLPLHINDFVAFAQAGAPAICCYSGCHSGAL